MKLNLDELNTTNILLLVNESELEGQNRAFYSFVMEALDHKELTFALMSVIRGHLKCLLENNMIKQYIRNKGIEYKVAEPGKKLIEQIKLTKQAEGLNK